MKREMLYVLVGMLLTTVVTSAAATGNSTKTFVEQKICDRETIDHKVCFKCHVEANGYGDCALSLFIQPSEGDCFAGWVHMWFYSNASIMVDYWNYEGKGVIDLIGYTGLFEFNETTHTYTVNGDALFCFARGK